MPKDDATKSAPTAKPKADADELTVSVHGDMMFPYAKNGRVVDGARMPHAQRWKHAAAAALHCWSQHAHHEAREMTLSADDYAQAIEAACKLDSKGIPHPHKPAFYAVATPKA